MSKGNERRKVLLVDRKTQLKYVGLILGAIVGINLLVAFCVYFSVWGTLTNEYSRIAIAQKLQLVQRMQSYNAVREGQPGQNTYNMEEEADLLSDHLLGQLRESFHKAEAKLVPVLLLLLLVVIFEGIAISHRIVGPIYHAEKTLAQLGQGNLTTRTQFRKKDEFKGLGEKLNLVTEQWGYNISALKKQLGKITESAVGLKQSLGRYNPEMEMQVGAQADQILKRVSDCNNVLARFTVAQDTNAENNKES